MRPQHPCCLIVKATLTGVGLFVLACVAGCGGENTKPSAAGKDPLHAMRVAVLKGKWQDAWQYADAVSAAHADDADVLVMVAKAAHANNQPSRAADLLADACRAEQFTDQARIQQTLVAMVSVGRLFDGMAILAEAVEQQPEQDETRRALYDFYMGTENRAAGLPHGRKLVRRRKFDLELLDSLSNAQRRSMDAKPLTEMTTRNPTDKRPLVGKAKFNFDEGRFDESVQQLREIIDAHPNYMPAQALIGRAFVAAGQLDMFEKWVSQLVPGIEDQAGFWTGLGDWARAQQSHDQAARAYWEATRCDADIVEVWSKLSTEAKQLQSTHPQISDDVVSQFNRRATLLSKFEQSKDRFNRTGKISRAVVAEIVETLRDLGRLWEAEAWAALGTTFPEDDAVPLDAVRQSVVSLLSANTPWQLTDNTALAIDLSMLPLPSIGRVADLNLARSTPQAAAVDTGGIRLINEARQRGLSYFGRTSDNLNVPGIMLYETLGCGGGTIDFDLDGWSDLYLMGAGGKPPLRDSQPNALLRNIHGQFTDATKPSHAGDTGFGQGVAVGDVNEDGFPDLVVLNYGPNVLLINNGDGTFIDSSDQLPEYVDSKAWSTSAAIADVDGDGISDLFITHYCAGLEPSTQSCPTEGSKVANSCTPMKFPGTIDTFLQGAGDGSFVDRTQDWGVDPAVPGRGLGIVVGSFDERPGLDVFIANDMTNNHFWSRTHNAPPQDAPLQLTESAMLRGLGGDDRSNAQGSMGIATGDFGADGDIDFYVTNFFNEYNTFHQQQSAGVWQDRTAAQQLVQPTMPLVAFGTQAIDLDNDGSLELIVANGHVDMFTRNGEKSVYAQPMQIFRQSKQQIMSSIEQAVGGDYVSQPHVGRALWTIDANRDHKTDMVVTHQTEPVALLINRSESQNGGGQQQWIELEIHGRSCSRDAIGSIVQLRGASGQRSIPLVAGDGYMCSNDRTLHIGVGGDKTVDLDVVWSDGSRQTYGQLKTNARWQLVQGLPAEPSDLPEIGK